MNGSGYIFNRTRGVPKLGLLEPNQDMLARAIPLSVVLTGKIPEHDVVDDHYSSVADKFQLYGNDRYSNCGPVAVANQRGLITTYLADRQVFPTFEEVMDLYSRSTVPSFNPVTGENDRGIVMQIMCQELVKNGIGGVKAVAFAKINLFDLKEASAAVNIFGSILIGLRLRQAQEQQMSSGVLDYVWNSPPWGGHAVLGAGYAENDETNTGKVVTWGNVMSMTYPFIKNQMSEAWVVIWPENLGTKQFEQGINLSMLKEAYSDVTGKQLILP